MSKDMVKRPDHYCFSKFEPKDVIREWGLNFNLGSAVKYIARAGRKDDIVQDLKKAREFLSFEIEALEKERGVYKSEGFPEHPNCRCSTPEQDKVQVELNRKHRAFYHSFRNMLCRAKQTIKHRSAEGAIIEMGIDMNVDADVDKMLDGFKTYVEGMFR